MKEDIEIYEYISVNVKNELEQMYIDCYKKFGWIYINNERKDYYINSNPDPSKVEIKFKRSRKIENKEELQKLQDKCEKAVLTVYKLEKMSHSLATIYSLIIGCIAAIIIAIAVLAVIGKNWLLAVPCGVTGLIGCVFPYFIYINVKDRKKEENKTKIHQQENIIYDTCEQARKILSE